MLSLLVPFLWLLLIVCGIAWAVADWILPNIPGAPAGARRIVWAIAGIIVLVWVLEHVLPAAGIH